MAILHRDVFINKSAPASKTIPVSLGDFLKLQVKSNEAFQIKISGIIDSKFTNAPVIATNDMTFAMSDTITTQGIYTIATTGMNSITIELISGIDINCTVSLH